MGVTELLIIGGIVVVLFGARRLPEIGSGLGKAIKGFKAGIKEEDVATLPDGSDKPREDD